MKITVKFLGSLRFEIGTPVLELDLDGEDKSVKDVIEKIIEIKGEKAKRRILYKDGGIGVILVLNGKRCSLDEKVKQGDEFLMMAPISGG